MKENRFKKIRLWKNLTVREAAEALNFSPSYISAIENGHKEASPEIRAAYAHAFPLDDSYFLFLSSYQKLDEEHHIITLRQG
ncbi:helix-turn-helix domain-containing protein [Paenisporosarcina sp. NPDC076898]|uniref:helix-turn-helix domain-containing protein n=1 Tax=unclassified Paenisporosarcina TaxID=2642018 RepID=UPI003D047433